VFYIKMPYADVSRYTPLLGWVLLQLDTLKKSLVSEFYIRVHSNYSI